VTRGVDAMQSDSGILAQVALAVDVAVSPLGDMIAVAAAGSDPHARGDAPTASVVVVSVEAEFSDVPDRRCTVPHVMSNQGSIVAVEFDEAGRIIAQSREPARLFRIDPSTTSHETIELLGDVREDTGHELFHRATACTLACASCHPEGQDDGQVWHFAELGPRRTMAVDAALSAAAPYHWDGHLVDFAALVDEIYVGRMGGLEQSEDRIDALQVWLESIRPRRGPQKADDALVQAGQRIFEEAGCPSCHVPPGYGSPVNVALSGGSVLQAPPLLGIAVRPPYMHDGRHTDLRAAAVEMLQRTAPTHPRDDATVDALLAFLQSL